MDKALWNIGTQEYPVIQGQDGLPFYHQDGGFRRFGSNSWSWSFVNNHCLCNCKNYLYYVNYIHLDSDQRQVFQSNSSVEQKFYFDKLIGPVQGYAFNTPKLRCIPKYLPKGTFTTGESQVPSLPYSSKRKALKTRPCPQYYYREAPFGCATTIRRYINTYQSSDCGVPVKSSEGYYGECRWYWATFNVTNLQVSQEQPQASYMEGTGGCDDFAHPPVKVVLQDCHTAIVTVALVPLAGAQEDDDTPYNFSNSEMKYAAIEAAKNALHENPCVYWALYRMVIPCCQHPPFPKPGIDWLKLESSEGVPPEIWGKGIGMGPASWHQDQQLTWYSEDSYSFYYYWLSNPGDDPQLPTISGQPCQKICADVPQDGFVFPSDSKTTQLSYCSSSLCPQAPPCNIKQDFPYFYIRNEVQFPLFDIWRKSAVTAGLPWQKVQESLNDWQLLPQWDFVQYRFHRDSNDQIQYAQKVVDVLDPQPSQSIDFSAIPQGVQYQTYDSLAYYSQFDNYWQLYFKCSSGKGVCDGARCVASMISGDNWNVLAAQHRVCLNKWQVATCQNTFVDPFPYGEPPGDFVYTFKTSAITRQVCIERSGYQLHLTGKDFDSTVQMPKKKLAMRKRIAQPQCKSNSLVIKFGEWQVITSANYSSSSLSNLDCDFNGIPQNGWYQQPRCPKSICSDAYDYMDTAYWADMKQSLGQLQPVWTQGGVITPGRKRKSKYDIYDTQPICQILQIKQISAAWDPVWDDESTSGQGYCNKLLYTEQFSSDSEESITVSWQRDCVDDQPVGYGLAVYVISPAISPGVAFQQKSAGRYTVKATKLFSVTQETQAAWEASHGTGTIQTGFYTVNGALPLTSEPWFNNNQVQLPANISRFQTPSSGQSGVTFSWQIAEKVAAWQGSDYQTMAWRIYVAFGQLDSELCVPSSLLQTRFSGVYGQSMQSLRKVCFRLSLQTSTCTAYGNYPAYTTDSFTRPSSVTASDYVIHRYANNKLSVEDLNVYADTIEWAWPNDATPVTIPTGLVVQDNEAAATALGKVSTSGVKSGNDAIWWYQKLSGQTYPTSIGPFWVFAMSLPAVYIPTSKQYISVQTKDVSSPSGSCRLARLSQTVTADGKAYILNQMKSAVLDLGDTGILWIYAPSYLVTGDYDSFDAKYACQHGGHWKTRQISYSQIQQWVRTDDPSTQYDEAGKRTLTRTFDNYTVVGSQRIPYNAPGQHRKQVVQGVSRLDYDDISDSACLPGNMWLGWHYDSYPYYVIPPAYRRNPDSNCSSDSICTSNWYLCFDYFPNLYHQDLIALQYFPENPGKSCRLIGSNSQDCTGRVKTLLKVPTKAEGGDEFTTGFSLNYTRTDTISSDETYTITVTGSFSGTFVQGAPPTEWFPQG